VYNEIQENDYQLFTWKVFILWKNLWLLIL